MSKTDDKREPTGLTDEQVLVEADAVDPFMVPREGRDKVCALARRVEAIERERCGKIAHDEYEKWKATDSIDGIGAAANIYSKIISCAPGRTMMPDKTGLTDEQIDREIDNWCADVALAITKVRSQYRIDLRVLARQIEAIVRKDERRNVLYAWRHLDRKDFGEWIMQRGGR